MTLRQAHGGGELRVIVDQLLAEVPGGIGRYTADLATALVATAPAGREVVGVLSAVGRNAIEGIRGALPGLARLDVLPRSRRALSLAWQLGLVSARDLPPGSATHGPSQFTPLARSRGGSLVTVTIHDAVPWTHPETLTRYGAQWHRAMARRAARFADAIAVPTQAVADELRTWVELGDRVRVIGGAPSDSLALPADADARAAALGLPAEYVLAVGTLEPRKGLDALIRAMASPEAADLPLVVAGPPGWGGVDLAAIAAEAGLASNRLVTLGRIPDPDLAVAYDRATVFAFPSRAEGFGLPVLEAMRLGAPVVYTDVPAVLEIAGGRRTRRRAEAGRRLPGAVRRGAPCRRREPHPRRRDGDGRQGTGRGVLLAGERREGLGPPRLTRVAPSLFRSRRPFACNMHA